MAWTLLPARAQAPPAAVGSTSHPPTACAERIAWRRALVLPEGPPDPLSLARSPASVAIADGGLWLALATSTADKKGRVQPQIHILRALADQDPTRTTPLEVLDGDAPRLARLASGALVVVGREAKRRTLVAWRGSADGRRWKKPVRITKRAGTPASHGALVSTPDGGLVFPAMWAGSGTFEIVCLRSADGGESWQESTPLAVRAAADPELAVTRDGWLLTMRVRGRLVCSRSPDGGRTWSAPWDAGFDVAPVPHAVATDAAGLALWWTEPVRDTLRVRPWWHGVSQARSVDAGATWRRAAPLRFEPGAPPIVRATSNAGGDLFLLLETRRQGRRELAAARFAADWVARPGTLPGATAVADGYVIDARATRLALARHAAWVLGRTKRSPRLFVEGYFMRGLVAAADAAESAADGCDLGFDPRQAREVAVAWSESLLAAQAPEGTWWIGYDQRYYADMAAAAALLPALAPHVDAARVKRYEASIGRLLGDIETTGMRLPSGAHGIGFRLPTDALPVKTALREPYLVSTALVGIELNAWMWKQTHKREHRERALAALRYTLSQISADGFREPEARKEGVVRVASYVQEGWMAADRDLEDPQVLAELRRALPAHVRWLLRTQSEDGAWRGSDPTEFSRTPGVVDFLVWYDRRCESRADVRLAIRRANAFLVDPARWESEELWRNDEMHEVMRCHYGRPLAALVVGQPVR